MLLVVIAIIASYTALDLAGRVTLATGSARNLWLIGGAIAQQPAMVRLHGNDVRADQGLGLAVGLASERPAAMS